MLTRTPTVDDAPPTLQAAVRTAIDRGTRNASTTSAEVLSVLSKDIQTDVDRARNQMNAVRQRLDDAIDNPAGTRTAPNGWWRSRCSSLPLMS